MTPNPVTNMNNLCFVIEKKNSPYPICALYMAKNRTRPARAT